MVSIDHVHMVRVSVREHADDPARPAAPGRHGHVPLLCADCESTLEVVARFLALLELYREGLVGFDQVQALGELTVRWTGPADGDAELRRRRVRRHARPTPTPVRRTGGRTPPSRRVRGGRGPRRRRRRVMSDEERRDSLAEQAAAWVPPWERPPPGRAPSPPDDRDRDAPGRQPSTTPRPDVARPPPADAAPTGATGEPPAGAGPVIRATPGRCRTDDRGAGGPAEPAAARRDRSGARRRPPTRR